MVALSLNKDDGKNQLLDYVGKVIDSGIIHSNRNYKFLINGSSRIFKIKIHNRKNHYEDANKTILLYIYTIAHKKETSDLEKHFCLKLELKGNRTKNKRQYFFTESYIHGIYKHKCSNPIMNGKFIVQLAENINKIFKVEYFNQIIKNLDKISIEQLLFFVRTLYILPVFFIIPLNIILIYMILVYRLKD